MQYVSFILAHICLSLEGVLHTKKLIGIVKPMSSTSIGVYYRAIMFRFSTRLMTLKGPGLKRKSWSCDMLSREPCVASVNIPPCAGSNVNDLFPIYTFK
jgi:hypothetical protein